MNIHSPVASVVKPELPSPVFAERRTAILDAGERCFILHGFHRATMQDLARMAGMSVGNLYRYFPSKDAVVLALAERDRAEAGRHLCHAGADLYPALLRLIHAHLVEQPREKAVLLLEVWAEGTRNPTIAAMLTGFEAENQAWIAEALRSRGTLSPQDAADLADDVRTACRGILVSRAVSADFNPEPATRRLLAALEARTALPGPAGVAQLALEPLA